MKMQSTTTRPGNVTGQRRATFKLVAGLCSAFLIINCSAPTEPVDIPQQVADPLLRPHLTQATRPLWRDHILAPKSELAWEEVPWRPSFLTGLREAGERGKPLLLWVMNGHPLGCT